MYQLGNGTWSVPVTVFEFRFRFISNNTVKDKLQLLSKKSSVVLNFETHRNETTP